MSEQGEQYDSIEREVDRLTAEVERLTRERDGAEAMHNAFAAVARALQRQVTSLTAERDALLTVCLADEHFGYEYELDDISGEIINELCRGCGQPYGSSHTGSCPHAESIKRVEGMR